MYNIFSAEAARSTAWFVLPIFLIAITLTGSVPSLEPSVAQAEVSSFYPGDAQIISLIADEELGARVVGTDVGPAGDPEEPDDQERENDEVVGPNGEAPAPISVEGLSPAWNTIMVTATFTAPYGASWSMETDPAYPLFFECTGSSGVEVFSGTYEEPAFASAGTATTDGSVSCSAYTDFVTTEELGPVVVKFNLLGNAGEFVQNPVPKQAQKTVNVVRLELSVDWKTYPKAPTFSAEIQEAPVAISGTSPSDAIDRAIAANAALTSFAAEKNGDIYLYTLALGKKVGANITCVLTPGKLSTINPNTGTKLVTNVDWYFFNADVSYPVKVAFPVFDHLMYLADTNQRAALDAFSNTLKAHEFMHAAIFQRFITVDEKNLVATDLKKMLVKKLQTDYGLVGDTMTFAPGSAHYNAVNGAGSLDGGCITLVKEAAYNTLSERMGTHLDAYINNDVAQGLKPQRANVQTLWGLMEWDNINLDLPVGHFCLHEQEAPGPASEAAAIAVCNPALNPAPPIPWMRVRATGKIENIATGQGKTWANHFLSYFRTK